MGRMPATYATYATSAMLCAAFAAIPACAPRGTTADGDEGPVPAAVAEPAQGASSARTGRIGRELAAKPAQGADAEAHANGAHGGHGAHGPRPAALMSPAGDYPAVAPGEAVLRNQSRTPGVVEVELTATRARMELAPGVQTNAFAYNGRVPGPLLDVREGDRVRVRFRNELPEATTVHWHGLHLPVDSDGSPFDPVEPGGTRDYVFTIPHGTAGTYWYHPHPHHRTGYQVGKGLYGGIIVRAADDPLAHIPEQLLILSDNRFAGDGGIDIAPEGSMQARIDFENGREGDVLFVNGLVNPTLDIRAGDVQRWRIVNASGARVYRLALEGHTFLHVGTDGGLFETPVEVKEILIGNGERIELLVRGTAQPGSHVALQTLPYDRYIRQTRPKDWERPRDLLTLRYSDAKPVKSPAIPRTLRRIEWIDRTTSSATRTMVLTQGFINGLQMDVDRVDVASTLGATEIWEVENLVGMDHPFHLHGFRFQVIDRNGVPEPFPTWKDVVHVPRHSSARFIVRYENFPGKWMFHCHILDHEDHGMMGILEIR